jgi:hypothetical protein
MLSFIAKVVEINIELIVRILSRGILSRFNGWGLLRGLCSTGWVPALKLHQLLDRKSRPHAGHMLLVRILGRTNFHLFWLGIGTALGYNQPDERLTPEVITTVPQPSVFGKQVAIAVALKRIAVLARRLTTE